MSEGAKGTAAVMAPAALTRLRQDGPLAPRSVTFESEPLPADLRISGQPTFHVTVRSPTPGGNVFAELAEVTAEGDIIPLGWAAMDLRYAGGGKTPTAYVPNTDVLALMEFYPMDVRLAAGSKLVLLVSGDAGPVLPNAASSSLVFTLGDDKTTLSLPTIERPDVPTRWDVADGTVKAEYA